MDYRNKLIGPSQTTVATIGGVERIRRLRRRARMTKKTAGWGRTVAAAATLLLALGLLDCSEERNKFVAPPPPKVGVALPLQKAVTPDLELTGTAAAFASVNLVARIEGYLKSINYVDGSIAKAGELLFEIDPVPYQVQVEQAKAAVASAHADLVFAQKEFQRQSALLTEDVNSQAQTDRARAKRDSDQANVEGQEASLQNAQINLSYTRIDAPFDGIVTRHLASVGELVGTGGHTNLASIVQIDPIYVMFNVSDQDLMKFRANQGSRRLTLAEIQQVPVEVGLMSETGFPHGGKVSYVSPELDPQTATILVRGVFENKNGARWIRRTGVSTACS
jgi:RND family efflux transporter MFP subunit